ncbi:hypothetical protein CRUP_010593 [Coryphaenoides rupestris]|nr:hypothetical protein CRUP_010593 [Coryphaenoides rupestris]
MPYVTVCGRIQGLGQNGVRLRPDQPVQLTGAEGGPGRVPRSFFCGGSAIAVPPGAAFPLGPGGLLLLLLRLAGGRRRLHRRGDRSRSSGRDDRLAAPARGLELGQEVLEGEARNSIRMIHSCLWEEPGVRGRQRKETGPRGWRGSGPPGTTVVLPCLRPDSGSTAANRPNTWQLPAALVTAFSMASTSEARAVVVDRTMYISGQLGMDTASGQLVEGGVEAQTKQALVNMGEILKSAECGYENVFSSNFPARAAYQVAALPRGGLVEIEAVAVLGPLTVADNKL